MDLQQRFRQPDVFQTGAGGKTVPRDHVDPVRQHDVRQAVAGGEGVFIEDPDSLRDDACAGRRRHAGKERQPVLFHGIEEPVLEPEPRLVVRDDEPAAGPGERAAADAFDPRSNRNRRQIAAAEKRAYADRPHAVRDADLGQVDAPGKHARLDGFDAVRDVDFFQGGAVREHGFRDQQASLPVGTPPLIASRRGYGGRGAHPGGQPYFLQTGAVLERR